jgi:hypothetical protein
VYGQPDPPGVVQPHAVDARHTPDIGDGDVDVVRRLVAEADQFGGRVVAEREPAPARRTAAQSRAGRPGSPEKVA